MRLWWLFQPNSSWPPDIWFTACMVHPRASLLVELDAQERCPDCSRYCFERVSTSSSQQLDKLHPLSWEEGKSLKIVSQYGAYTSSSFCTYFGKQKLPRWWLNCNIHGSIYISLFWTCKFQCSLLGWLIYHLSWFQYRGMWSLESLQASKFLNLYRQWQLDLALDVRRWRAVSFLPLLSIFLWYLALLV